jgi:8-oxo-dGTP diphosphatase
MDDITEAESSPAQPEVAVAIVTSGLGVVICRRRDGNPPWSFPGGKVEPGESPEDAASAGDARRDRAAGPGYRGDRQQGASGGRGRDDVRGGELAAEPGVMVGDDGELIDFRWVSLAEAEAPMEEMSGDVRRFLALVLGS